MHTLIVEKEGKSDDDEGKWQEGRQKWEKSPTPAFTESKQSTKSTNRLEVEAGKEEERKRREKEEGEGSEYNNLFSKRKNVTETTTTSSSCSFFMIPVQQEIRPYRSELGQTLILLLFLFSFSSPQFIPFWTTQKTSASLSTQKWMPTDLEETGDRQTRKHGPGSFFQVKKMSGMFKRTKITKKKEAKFQNWNE